MGKSTLFLLLIQKHLVWQVTKKQQKKVRQVRRAEERLTHAGDRNRPTKESESAQAHFLTVLLGINTWFRFQISCSESIGCGRKCQKVFASIKIDFRTRKSPADLPQSNFSLCHCLYFGQISQGFTEDFLEYGFAFHQGLLLQQFLSQLLWYCSDQLFQILTKHTPGEAYQVGLQHLLLQSFRFKLCLGCQCYCQSGFLIGEFITCSPLHHKFQHIRQVVESAMHFLRMDGAAF